MADRTAMLLTEDEWQALAEVCRQWITGDTNLGVGAAEQERVAHRILKAVDGDWNAVGGD